MTDLAPLERAVLSPGIRSRFVSDINCLRVHMLEAGFETPGRWEPARGSFLDADGNRDVGTGTRQAEKRHRLIRGDHAAGRVDSSLPPRGGGRSNCQLPQRRDETVPAWECRPGRSASPGASAASRTTRSVEDGIPTEDCGNEGRYQRGGVGRGVSTWPVQ